MTKREIIELLKSGDFTIAYHDSGYCCLYQGKIPYSKLPEESIKEFEGTTKGYIPCEVELLVVALGGKVSSI